MDRPETQFAWNGDTSLAFQVVGEGEADILYAAGYVSNVELNWEHPAKARFVRALARSARLIVMDPRGLDTAGDGFLASFDGRRARSDALKRLGIEIRPGLHTGECEVIDGKVGGMAVNIGARVGSAARPSEVLVSQTVKDLVVGSELAFEDRGEHKLKGVDAPWRLYRVVG